MCCILKLHKEKSGSAFSRKVGRAEEVANLAVVTLGMFGLAYSLGQNDLSCRWKIRICK